MLNEVKDLGSVLDLFKYDKVAFFHSVRMHLMAENQSSKEIKAETLQCACLVHDVGKLDCNMYTEYADGNLYVYYPLIKIHPEASYERVRPYDETLARICCMHHQFQQEKYPKKLPFTFYDVTEEDYVTKYALALSALDFLDADTYRQGKLPTMKSVDRVVKHKSKYAVDFVDEPEQFVRDVLAGCFLKDADMRFASKYREVKRDENNQSTG